MDLIDPVMIAGAFVLLNLWTFMLFGFDKLRAEAGHWRIAESTLLSLAFIGGSAGALLGRTIFRHKTSKQPFSSSLNAIAIFHMLMASAALGWFLV